jgi:hypothetical protein
LGNYLKWGFFGSDRSGANQEFNDGFHDRLYRAGILANPDIWESRVMDILYDIYVIPIRGFGVIFAEIVQGFTLSMGNFLCFFF